MCISRSHTEMSLPSSSMWAHLPGYPRRLVKMSGCTLVSSYCSRKASTSKHQSVYVTSAPGSVDLKISISNLAGASRFLSLLPLQPLCLCLQPPVSLAVEYPSESGTPLLGEEGGKPPPLTVVHWYFSGLPHSRTAPVWGGEPCLSPLSHPGGSSVLLRCTFPSWLEESDSCAAPTGVLWAEFSARVLSLQWSEAATDCCHASIRGRRLMLKWAEHEIHSEKASSMWVWTASAASCPKPQQPCLS